MHVHAIHRPLHWCARGYNTGSGEARPVIRTWMRYWGGSVFHHALSRCTSFISTFSGTQTTVTPQLAWTFSTQGMTFVPSISCWLVRLILICFISTAMPRVAASTQNETVTAFEPSVILTGDWKSNGSHGISHMNTKSGGASAQYSFRGMSPEVLYDGVFRPQLSNLSLLPLLR